MHRYLATFAPGFEEIIGTLLLRTVPETYDIEVSSGILFFSFDGSPEKLITAAFFNNVFLIVRRWKTNLSPFPEMVKNTANEPMLSSIPALFSTLGVHSFRVRFSRENQFCSVDKKVMDGSEKNIRSMTGLVPDRLNPDMEFWYIIRREGYSFFAARLTRKQSTEKYLAQGELRPEIVQLLIALAGVTDHDTVLIDPFAGYGSIPAQLAILYNNALIYAGDNDQDRIQDLKKRFPAGGRVVVQCADALNLSFCASSSVDVIVTDPPWGFWENGGEKDARTIEQLYEGMVREFDRILNAGGRAVVLTGAKREFDDAVAKSASFSHCLTEKGYRTDILVNGKKSAVFKLARKI